jgi:AraC-like DNA-binding protein
MANQVKDVGGIIYSCYPEENRAGEQFLSEHSLGYIIAGELAIIEGNHTSTFREGDMVLFRKNHLAKFIKLPAKGGQFIATTIILDKELLMNFSKERQLTGGNYSRQAVVLSIGPDNLLKHYFDSLLPYFDEKINADLVAYKKQEAILLLLRKDPALKDVLFDFGAPGKIDLEAFMNTNFRYNVPLERLAYLTGRSLATFKRDFDKLFNTSPNRWIQEQRLKEAHYLISKKKIKPSDVYLEVGFESLPHFSYAFKKYFGKNPSSL